MGHQLHGYISDVGVRNVGGWALDENLQPFEMIISIDGVEAARGYPTIVRPDLAHFTAGPAGFDFVLPHPIAHGAVVTIADAKGRQLQNSPYRPSAIQGDRKAKTLCALTNEMKILEIGPSFNPMAPRSQGWNSYSLDHGTQEELRAKYANSEPIEKIEPVDFVWRGGPIDEAVAVEHHGTFDAVIISHVIEHFPDPIGFYLSSAKLLKSNGLISLAVPDKRTMFDFFKSVSTTGDLLSAYYERRTRHTGKAAFDNLAYNVTSRGEVAWTWREFDDFAFASGAQSLEAAKTVFDVAVSNPDGAYVDYHNTIYTPSSFELTILELGQLGIIPFEIAHTYPSEGCEFFATLRKAEPHRLHPEALAAERMRLMKASVRELGEQARWLSE